MPVSFIREMTEHAVRGVPPEDLVEPLAMVLTSRRSGLPGTRFDPSEEMAAALFELRRHPVEPFAGRVAATLLWLRRVARPPNPLDRYHQAVGTVRNLAFQLERVGHTRPTDVAKLKVQDFSRMQTSLGELASERPLPGMHLAALVETVIWALLDEAQVALWLLGCLGADLSSDSRHRIVERLSSTIDEASVQPPTESVVCFDLNAPPRFSPALHPRWHRQYVAVPALVARGLDL